MIFLTNSDNVQLEYTGLKAKIVTTVGMGTYDLKIGEFKAFASGTIKFIATGIRGSAFYMQYNHIKIKKIVDGTTTIVAQGANADSTQNYDYATVTCPVQRGDLLEVYICPYLNSNTNYYHPVDKLQICYDIIEKEDYYFEGV